MNVEAYRKTIRRRVGIMVAVGLLYAAAMVAVHVLEPVKMSYADDFLIGILTGLVICFSVIVPRYRKALHDEQALRRLWNKEHDERMRAIKAKAGVPMVLYTSAAMIAAALLVASWNMTVAITLLVAATVQLVISVAVKLTCMRTM